MGLFGNSYDSQSDHSCTIGHYGQKIIDSCTYCKVCNICEQAKIKNKAQKALLYNELGRTLQINGDFCNFKNLRTITLERISCWCHHQRQ